MTTQQLNFLSAVKAPALASAAQTGIPAVVTLAQAILESATSAGWGTSSLYLNANNPFGIKYMTAHADWGFVALPTREVVDYKVVTVEAQFQKFPSLTAAFLTHANILLGPRYQPAYLVRSDWQQYAQRLSGKSSPTDTTHCGYSTNPKYGDAIVNLVERDNLLAFLSSV